MLIGRNNAILGNIVIRMTEMSIPNQLMISNILSGQY